MFASGASATSRSTGSQSLVVKKDRHEVVGKNHASPPAQEIHLPAGTALVIEAAQDLTLKGPGGFIRIDAERRDDPRQRSASTAAARPERKGREPRDAGRRRRRR
jgi:hypothetical protein